MRSVGTEEEVKGVRKREVMAKTRASSSGKTCVASVVEWYWV